MRQVLTSDSAQSEIDWGSSPGVLIDCKKGKEPALRATFGESFGHELKGLSQIRAHPGLRSSGLTKGGPQYSGYRRRRASMG